MNFSIGLLRYVWIGIGSSGLLERGRGSREGFSGRLSNIGQSMINLNIKTKLSNKTHQTLKKELIIFKLTTRPRQSSPIVILSKGPHNITPRIKRLIKKEIS